MVTAGILPFKENSRSRTRNRTRDLMISSQRLWPLDHEAGHIYKYTMMYQSSTKNFIMFIIVLRQHVSILTESSSGPYKIQILT